MASNAEMHLMYKTANAPISWFPFPHCFIEDVFPAETYADIQRNIPESSAMTSLADTGRVTPGAYKERFILPLGGDDMSRLPAATQQFWTDFSSWLLSGRYKKLLLDKFKPLVAQRIPDQTKIDFRDEAMLVQDVTKYSLGPHTDLQTKVVTSSLSAKGYVADAPWHLDLSAATARLLVQARRRQARGSGLDPGAESAHREGKTPHGVGAELLFPVPARQHAFHRGGGQFRERLENDEGKQAVPERAGPGAGGAGGGAGDRPAGSARRRPAASGSCRT